MFIKKNSAGPEISNRVSLLPFLYCHNVSWWLLFYSADYISTVREEEDNSAKVSEQQHQLDQFTRRTVTSVSLAQREYTVNSSPTNPKKNELLFQLKGQTHK